MKPRGSNAIKAYRWLGSNQAQQKLLPLSLLVGGQIPLEDSLIGPSTSMVYQQSSPDKYDPSLEQQSIDWSPSQVSQSSTPRLPLLSWKRSGDRSYQSDQKSGSSFSPNMRKPSEYISASQKSKKEEQVESLRRFHRNEKDGYLEMIIVIKRLNEKYLLLEEPISKTLSETLLHSEYLLDAQNSISQFSFNLENYSARVDLFKDFTDSFLLGFPSFMKELNPIFQLRDSLIFCSDEQIRAAFQNVLDKPSFQKKKFTYFEALVAAIEISQKTQKKHEENMKQMQFVLETLKETVQQQENKILEANNRAKVAELAIEKSKESSNSELARSIIEFQKDKNSLHATLQEEKNHFLQGYYDAEHNYVKQIQDCQTVIMQKMEEIKALHQFKDKQGIELDTLKIKFDTLRSNHVAAVEELKDSTNKIKEIQERLNLSQEQYRKLQLKSGLRYDDLTPRPSFSQISKQIEDFSIELSQQPQQTSCEQSIILLSKPFLKSSSQQTLIGSTIQKVDEISELLTAVLKIKPKKSPIILASKCSNKKKNHMNDTSKSVSKLKVSKMKPPLSIDLTINQTETQVEIIKKEEEEPSRPSSKQSIPQPPNINE